MTCRHWGVRWKFLSYLEGTLETDQVHAVEARLTGCAACREAFARLKDGHELAGRLARIEKENAAAGRGFEAAPLFKPAMIEAGQGSLSRRRWDGRRMRWSLIMAHPRTIWVLAAVVIAQAALVTVWKRDVIFGKAVSPVASISGIDIDRFRNLNIAEMPLNSHPHVVTEGYVRNVWMDAEEKTLHFKLSESPAGDSAFVVCEILSPDRISAPRAGSRVKVYGVARYDGQAGRQWQEVNPVLDIAVLKR
jgi:hypothetical protein